ncbi:RNA polymerase sigma factor SigZ [Flammeovirga kamogawensis]|uniref:RNA polymerase sigma factor SigZ n=1 Tax=Flammeovirga kamogawensis TaxID=373891 RepID=A0ABX8H368_9BACT|nr:RNA polymerase sigma factor SigZ [Flammeovirga kamogawensis]MBB6460293.1 RNA polymerase sigma-70 factor (ECF subfamily) [Flammeovirga kamogawensis]QWG10103.1 RNA polymerase sigma factor SigZ [Flammeovirga kamogawensis]TRX65610.1 RNA polymerase sigma factor SigZ [Flammeovirga kamogawensis]
MMNTNEIWRQFKDELLGFIKSKVNDAALAEDILQEIFIKIHQKKNSLTNNQKLQSWVYQITRNAIIDHYRKKKNSNTDINALDLPQETEEDSASFVACTECVKPFILELPEIYKDVLLKVTYTKMSQKEYAENIGITYPTVKARIQRGREKLKTSFENCCKIIDGEFIERKISCSSGCKNK